jgi:hypothetical protein
MWQGRPALNTITCVVFDGYSTNISELYATQQDAIHEVQFKASVLSDIIHTVGWTVSSPHYEFILCSYTQRMLTNQRKCDPL